MWNDLTMSERAGVIKMAVKAGLRDMKSIRDFYDNSLKYADGGPKKSFDDWYKTVPVDRNDTTNYNLRRAYELAPIKELESWRTSSIEDLRNDKNHLRSVYKDPNTGIYNFVKSKNHPTVSLELDWYNSKDATDFRSKYDLDTSGDYYRYVPKPDYNITLPEVTVLGSKKYTDGGSINISPSKRGTFTAAATKHGMGVQEFASKVLADKDNYSPTMVKKANFAKNASKWKHSLGGYLFEEGGPKVTLVDSNKVRMNDSGIFSDENGNIIGDSVVLPEVTVRAHKGYKSTYDKDPVNAGKITKGIGDLAAYTKAYLNSKFKPSEGEIIDLSDKEVARIKSNTDDVSSILTNDFVESKNSNLIRKKENFINTKDTLLGDRKIPLSKISTFYGIENGKLKAGPLSIFNDTTTVVPNRAKYIGKIREYHPNTSKVDKDEYLDSLKAAVRRYNIEHNYKPKGLEKILLPIIEDNPQYTLYQNVGDDSHAIIHKLAEPYKHLKDKSNNSYAITESGDTIRPYNINATPKTLFADEDGNAIFTSLSESNLDELNKRLNKTPMYPIMVDNGRYAFYQTESPNVGVYSGLDNPNEMFILGTITKKKKKGKVK